MKLSVSSYSFMQYIRAGKMTQLDCVAKAKEMGFDAIEFVEIDGAPDYALQVENAKRIRAQADQVGIAINAYAVGACLYWGSAEKDAAEVERLKRQLDIAHILGAKVMRHDSYGWMEKKGDFRSFDRMLPTVANNVRQVADYGESLGIMTCTENHGYISQDSDRMERLFNAVAHDNYGLLVDIGNFVCVDEDPATAVSRVAPYAIHVHIKDMYVRDEPGAFICSSTRGGRYFGGAVVGEGDVPVKRCLRILKLAGYDDYLSLEYEGMEDCFSAIARGKRNVQRYLEQI
ncbi:MAG: sugar phosphate isomerase/epimerase [Clostridia bacterium]|nr:sugar phosphate isomerase/epimerase [Clostridia bacterium]